MERLMTSSISYKRYFRMEKTTAIGTMNWAATERVWVTISATKREPADGFARSKNVMNKLTPMPVRIPTATPKTIHFSCWRSEEHTSELQSPCNIVCLYMLVKKQSLNIC